MSIKNHYLNALFQIINDLQSLEFTDYWETLSAQSGLLFLSWNACACRILIPDTQKYILAEMESAHTVIVSRGPFVKNGLDTIELLFERENLDPYVLTIPSCQSDKLFQITGDGLQLAVIPWTQDGAEFIFPAKYRIVNQISYHKPCEDE